MNTAIRPLRCDMRRDCSNPVTHIDAKGFVYCGACAVVRLNGARRGVRKLRPHEVKKLQRGEVINYRRATKVSAIDIETAQCGVCGDCVPVAAYGSYVCAKAEKEARAKADTCPKCGKADAGIAGVNETVCASCAALGADAFEFTRQGSGSCVVCEQPCSVYSVKGYSGIVEACEQHRVQVTRDAIADGAMHSTRYVLKELQADGTVWASSEVYDETDRHLRQNVNAGYSGSPRWAERLDGTFVYGLDRRGHLRGTNDICGCRNNAPSSAPGNWHLTTCELGRKLEAAQEKEHAS